MTFFRRKISPPAVILAACLLLFALKTYELHNLDRETAPVLNELTGGKPIGLRGFIREYMADPYGKAVTLSEHQLQLCRRISMALPAYQSALSWRNKALFFGFFTLVFVGLRRVTTNPAYRIAAQAFLRRMAAKAEPMVSKARERAGMAAPHAVHSIVTCPKCSQKLRLPSGKGRLRVTCSGCGTTFDCLT